MATIHFSLGAVAGMVMAFTGMDSWYFWAVAPITVLASVLIEHKWG